MRVCVYGGEGCLDLKNCGFLWKNPGYAPDIITKNYTILYSYKAINHKKQR